MIRAGTISLGFAAGLALAMPLRADSLATGSEENPYGPLVARNVFGLNPPAPPAPAQAAEPPPKITPNGIMTIFGHLQALFKVVEVTPGQPPKEKSYILTVGERQDDIEVVKIDDKANIVTFNNHGTIQDLPLVTGAADSGSAPAPSFGGPPGAIPFPPGGGMRNRFGNPMLRRPFGVPTPGSAPNFNPQGNPNSNPGFNGASAQPILGAGPAYVGNQNVQPQNVALTPEAQVLLMEQHRIETQPQVQNGTMPPLPPTIITPSDQGPPPIP